MPRAAYSDTIGSIMYTETCDARRSWSRKPNVLRTEKEWMGQSRCQELALLYVQVAVQRVGVVVSRDDVSGRGECRCES
jgi:hypothetical protein